MRRRRRDVYDPYRLENPSSSQRQLSWVLILGGLFGLISLFTFVRPQIDSVLTRSRLNDRVETDGVIIDRQIIGNLDTSNRVRITYRFEAYTLPEETLQTYTGSFVGSRGDALAEGSPIGIAYSAGDPGVNLPVSVLDDTTRDVMMLVCGGSLGIVALMVIALGLFARRIDIVRFYGDMAADPQGFSRKMQGK
jgi:hypothetical protein